MKYKYEDTLDIHNSIILVKVNTMTLLTCKELRIAKIHANTCVSLLTANMPIIQVPPSNGKSTITAFNKLLYHNMEVDKTKCCELA